MREVNSMSALYIVERRGRGGAYRATEAWWWRAVAAVLLGAAADHARVHGARHAVVVLAVDLGEHVPSNESEHCRV